MAIRTLGTVDNRSLADQARDLLRDAIFEGRIQPDARLTIEQIAADLRISRTPVREALKALESDGIVEIHPHRGAIVQRFDRAELRDRYSVRALLEGYAGELACRLGDPQQIALDLAANCDRLEQALAATPAGDVEPDALRRLTEINREFHERIVLASSSTTVERVLATLRMPLGYRLYIWRDTGNRHAILAAHRAIVRAFASADAQRCRTLIEAHLYESRDFLMASQADPVPVPR